MMDVIVGAFSGLKSAADLTQGLLALKTDAAVSAKVIELNGVISGVQQQLFSAQMDYSALLSRIHELETEITNSKNWEQEKLRYQLHELAPGTLVYRIKPSMQGHEPMHDLCPNCYEQNARSILQYSGYVKGHKSFSCSHCKSVFLGEMLPSQSVMELSPSQWESNDY